MGGSLCNLNTWLPKPCRRRRLAHMIAGFNVKDMSCLAPRNDMMVSSFYYCPAAYVCVRVDKPAANSCKISQHADTALTEAGRSSPRLPFIQGNIAFKGPASMASTQRMQQRQRMCSMSQVAGCVGQCLLHTAFLFTLVRQSIVGKA